MAKFVVTLVVETQEGKKQPAPTKGAITDIVQRALKQSAEHFSFEHDVNWKRARVRAIDLD